ncbi:MAG: hypothetical protein GKR96_11860 [Gammaproteobacteria bacterium]|nr:hypothetical protein [Gammaproteobacteria bacterium]
MNEIAVIEQPVDRIIRRRIAARTVGVHLSALPPELQALRSITENDYLTKDDLPDEICLTVSDGNKALLSKEEAWKFADEAGSKLEWKLLPDTSLGKAAGQLSSMGQGAYADYGRPSLNAYSFFYDYAVSSAKHSQIAIASQSVNGVVLGPLLIAVEAVGATGLTALGHTTRGARLTDKTVLSDIASTGLFEGGSAWVSAKFGVFTAVKAMRLTALFPVPGAHLAAVPVGLLVGATTAILSKRFANHCKDNAVDAAYQSVTKSKIPDSIGQVV